MAALLPGLDPARAWPFALAAALAAAGARMGRGLAASFAEPRHAGASLALLALAAGFGPVGAALAAAISIAWAWAHRGALVAPESDHGGALVLAAAFVGAPAALWAAPLVLDAGAIVEDVRWAGCSRFQRILVTEARGALRLWLDGQLQLASDDEQAYHESLVHPALALAASVRSALVLGGGDGLVVRELLRDPAIARVVVVDLDRVVTSLARRFEPLRTLGGASLDDARVTLVHDDALAWAPRAIARGERFDVVIVDLPDPSSEVLAPLFARETFETWSRLLEDGGVLSVQAGAPRAAPRAFASVVRTLEASGLSVLTLALDEPASFGGTAVALGTRAPASVPTALRVSPRWLGPERLRAAFASPDAQPSAEARVTTLADPAVLGYLRAAMRHGFGGAA